MTSSADMVVKQWATIFERTVATIMIKDPNF